MKTVLIPEENAKDLVEISENIKKRLEIIPVSRMDEVIAKALVRKPEPIVWDEESAKLAAAAATHGRAGDRRRRRPDRALGAAGRHKTETAPRKGAVFVCGLISP